MSIPPFRVICLLACIPLPGVLVRAEETPSLAPKEALQVASPISSSLSQVLGLRDAGAGVSVSEAAEIQRMEALPPSSIPLDEARLSSAISLIATAAGMSFVAPASEEFPEQVSVSTHSNPWRLLQLLAERYHFSMHLRDGIWLFDRERPGALVTRTYVLRHTNLDVFKASQNSFKMMGEGSSESGEVSQTNSAGGLVYSAQTQKIVDDLRGLVGLQPASVAGKPGLSEAAQGMPVAPGRSGGGNVIYLADTNALYVTATLNQHEHIAEYLRMMDKRVPQIRIEARFFETTQDPKSVIGMDPSGFQPGLTLSNMTTNVNLNHMGSTKAPENALLSADTLRFQMQALHTDEKSKLVNNPSVVVANNREAYFSVGDEEPFVASNTYNAGSVDAGLGTSQARIAIRRIGTSVNIIPTLFEGGEGEPSRIRLVVRVEVGVLKGFRHLNNVDVPVVSSQKYEYTVFVKAGETLAFGGLSGSSEAESVRKVPILGDIPLLGYVFKSHSKEAFQRNLVAYLTATIVPESVGAPAAGLAQQ